MFSGIIKYFLPRIIKGTVNTFRKIWIVLKGIVFKLINKSQLFICHSFDPSLYNFFTKKNNFGLFAFELKLNILLRNRVRILIQINRFNFFFLEEIVNFYLKLKHEKYLLNVKDFLVNPQEDFLDCYFGVVERLNSYLAKRDMRIELSDQDLPLIKRNLSAIEAKKKITQSSCAQIFDLWQEIKKLPYTFLTIIRYISLFSEEVIVGPWQVVFDIYHKCNTDCIHCWIHSPKAKKFLTKDFLDAKIGLETFKNITDDCLEMGVDAITLLADGEPMLNPEFLEMVGYIKKNNPFVQMITFSNALTLSGRLSNELVNLGLDEIWFSVPAATAETYVKICASKTAEDFEKIKRNISYICKLKKAINSVRLAKRKIFSRGTDIQNRRGKIYLPPYCTMAFVLHNMNYQEIIEMAKLAVELGVDEMRFQLIHLDKDNKHLILDQKQIDYLNSRLEEVRRIAKESNVNLSSALAFQLSNMYVPTGDWSKGYFVKQGCPIGFFFSIIKANGDVGLCCALKVIDSLKNRSFKDIWFSQEYKAARTAAKYLRSNKDMQFLSTAYHKGEARGDLLYSERCEYCDNHDMNNEVIDILVKRNLYPAVMGRTEKTDQPGEDR
jgi:MoaA/NifB/PqqE/SkfB family radical SAM enzyme